MSRQLETNGARLLVLGYVQILEWQVYPLPEDRRLLDFHAIVHESGHGLFAKRYGIPCHHVAIDVGRGTGIWSPRRIDAPMPARLPGESKQSLDYRAALEDVRVCLAGAAAEFLILGKITEGFDSDLYDIDRALRPFFREHEHAKIAAVVREQWAETLRIIRPAPPPPLMPLPPMFWRAPYIQLHMQQQAAMIESMTSGEERMITELASRLLRHRRLEGVDVNRILEGHEPPERLQFLAALQQVTARTA